MVGFQYDGYGLCFFSPKYHPSSTHEGLLKQYRVSEPWGPPRCFPRGPWIQLHLCIFSKFSFIVLVCHSYHNKIPWSGLPKPQFIFSQFWMLEVKEQEAGRFGFFLGLSPLLTDSFLLSVSRCVCVFCAYVPLVFSCVSKFPRIRTPFWLD